MNLQHALECITNSDAINKLNANIRLNDNITSSDIKWSKFDMLDVMSDLDYNGDNYYIDKISSFNGDLTLDAVNINNLQGNLKSLKINYNYSGTSVVSFETDTSIEELNFHTACLDRAGSNPSIINAIIKDSFLENLGKTDVNLEGFLSKSTNISRRASSNTTEHFMSLGYLTVDNNYNENWANVSIENPSSGISDHKYIIPQSFYNNLIFYVIENGSSSLTLDYINGFVEDLDETNIVIPNSSALKSDMPDEFPELPIILGEYCFGGIGSKPESEKDRHLYLHFGPDSFANKNVVEKGTEGGSIIETTVSLPFSENSFVSRPGAIQYIHINLPKERPQDSDPDELYFSDFFTKVEKNGDTTQYILDQPTFDLYINKLKSMVGGDESMLIFESPYEEIEAIIEVE